MSINNVAQPIQQAKRDYVIHVTAIQKCRKAHGIADATVKIQFGGAFQHSVAISDIRVMKSTKKRGELWISLPEFTTGKRSDGKWNYQASVQLSSTLYSEVEAAIKAAVRAKLVTKQATATAPQPTLQPTPAPAIDEPDSEFSEEDERAALGDELYNELHSHPEQDDELDGVA